MGQYLFLIGWQSCFGWFGDDLLVNFFFRSKSLYERAAMDGFWLLAPRAPGSSNFEAEKSWPDLHSWPTRGSAA
jgi:hypothetical protein